MSTNELIFDRSILNCKSYGSPELPAPKELAQSISNPPLFNAWNFKYLPWSIVTLVISPSCITNVVNWLVLVSV